MWPMIKGIFEVLFAGVLGCFGETGKPAHIAYVRHTLPSGEVVNVRPESYRNEFKGDFNDYGAFTSSSRLQMTILKLDRKSDKELAEVYGLVRDDRYGVKFAHPYYVYKNVIHSHVTKKPLADQSVAVWLKNNTQKAAGVYAVTI